MPRCVQLAAEISTGLPIDLNPVIDDFLCRALRGKPRPWSAIDSIDNTEFLARCHHHGIAALLFHCVSETDSWRDWPQEIRQNLELASKGGVAHDMLRKHYLGQLLESLAGLDIPCLLTKGEALAGSLYPVPGTRARSDSDLFIRMADIARVRQAVLELGYRIASTVYKSHQFTVVRPGDEPFSIRFDVHWRILNNPRFARAISFEEAFQNSVVFPGSASARILSKADALLLACLHRAGSEHHDANRLIWLFDIHMLVLGMSVDDLTEFALSAVKKQMQVICHDAIMKASSSFGTVMPEQVLALLSAPLTTEASGNRYADSQLALIFDDLKDLPDFASKLDLLREYVWPPETYLLARYQKAGRLWVPILYFRYLFGGLFERISLR